MLEERAKEIPVDRRKSPAGIEIDANGSVRARGRCLRPREPAEHEFNRACGTCCRGLLQKTSAGKGSHGHPSSVYNRRPNLHRCSRSVGPCVVRNERKAGRMFAGSFRPVTEVKPGTRTGLVVNSPCALQSYDSSQQVIAKLLLELR